MRCALRFLGLAWIGLLFPIAALAAESALEVSGEPQPGFGDPCACCDQDCDCYDCCDMFNDRQRILGMLPSDHCFDRFVSPISNPFFFEDPRSLTEVRGVFLDNTLPGVVGNGDVQVTGVQLRGRFADRWSVIAPRLAYFQVNQSGGGAPTGFMPAPVGVKYNFLRDVERQLLVSAGVTYFINGNINNFPPNGDGDFHFFLTGGKQIFDYGHWLSATGFRIPLDSNFGTQLWYWSNQWDYEVVDHWYGLFGVNWYHWMRSAGAGLPIGVTGLDLVNLPTGGVAGTNVATAVAGLKWKPSGHLEVGGGFEFPLTDRTDILKNRAYADIIFRY